MLAQLQRVFRKVFGDEKLEIDMGTSSKDIKMWDSLTHLELIVAVEEEFGIQFSFSEVMQFDTVGDMLNAVQELKNK